MSLTLGCVCVSSTIAQYVGLKWDVCIHCNTHLYALTWLISTCYLCFDITDIQTVVNCFTDCSHFLNNTKRSGDITKYFVAIFLHCTMFDLSMIRGWFQFRNIVTDTTQEGELILEYCLAYQHCCRSQYHKDSVNIGWFTNDNIPNIEVAISKSSLPENKYVNEVPTLPDQMACLKSLICLETKQAKSGCDVVLTVLLTVHWTKHCIILYIVFSLISPEYSCAIEDLSVCTHFWTHDYFSVHQFKVDYRYISLNDKI